MKKIYNKKGQGLVEYMVIVALMAVATMGMMRILSNTTTKKLASITQTIQGSRAGLSIEMEQIEESDIKKKDMSDFFHGSVSQGR